MVEQDDEQRVNDIEQARCAMIRATNSVGHASGDDAEGAFFLRVLANAGANTEGSAIPDAEMERILEWYERTVQDAAMLGLVLRGHVEIRHDGNNATFRLTSKGQQETGKHAP